MWLVESVDTQSIYTECWPYNKFSTTEIWFVSRKMHVFPGRELSPYAVLRLVLEDTAPENSPLYPSQRNSTS